MAIFNSTSTNWVEGGTGHQCGAGFQYRFWGYGYNGDWFGNWVRIASPTDYPTLHRFRVDRHADNNWYFFVDDKNVGTAVNWNARGYASAGLESYASAAAVGKH